MAFMETMFGAPDAAEAKRAKEREARELELARLATLDAYRRELAGYEYQIRIVDKDLARLTGLLADDSERDDAAEIGAQIELQKARRAKYEATIPLVRAEIKRRSK